MSTHAERAAAIAIATLAYREGNLDSESGRFETSLLLHQFDEIYSYIRDAIDEAAKEGSSLDIAAGEAAGEMGHALGLFSQPE